MIVLEQWRHRWSVKGILIHANLRPTSYPTGYIQ
jgi:hypothetical protein